MQESLECCLELNWIIEFGRALLLVCSRGKERDGGEGATKKGTFLLANILDDTQQQDRSTPSRLATFFWSLFTRMADAHSSKKNTGFFA